MEGAPATVCQSGEVRGQFVEADFLFYRVGLGHVTQIMRSGDECSYLLSFLAGPKIRDVL